MDSICLAALITSQLVIGSRVLAERYCIVFKASKLIELLLSSVILFLVIDAIIGQLPTVDMYGQRTVHADIPPSASDIREWSRSNKALFSSL